MSNLAYTENLYESFEQREALQEKLEQLNSEASSLAGKINSAEYKVRDAYNVFHSLESTLRNKKGSGKDTSSLESQFSDAGNELEQLKNNSSALKKRRDENNAERDDIKNSIETNNEGATVDQVIAHRNSVAEAQASVDNIQEIIAEQSKILSSDDVHDERIGQLQTEREEILADIAEGMPRKPDLKIIDDDIDRLVQDLDGAQADQLKSHREAQQTVNGLRKRLDTAQTRLQDLKNKTPKVLEQFLISEVEKAGAEYTKTAITLVEQFNRVNVLATMIAAKSDSDRPVINTPANRKMLIPSFYLQCFKDITEHDSVQGILFSAHHADRVGTPAMERQAEIDRFRGMGLSEYF